MAGWFEYNPENNTSTFKGQVLFVDQDSGEAPPKIRTLSGIPGQITAASLWTVRTGNFEKYYVAYQTDEIGGIYVGSVDDGVVHEYVAFNHSQYPHAKRIKGLVTQGGLFNAVIMASDTGIWAHVKSLVEEEYINPNPFLITDENAN